MRVQETIAAYENFYIVQDDIESGAPTPFP
jgi:hypothetical protein